VALRIFVVLLGTWRACEVGVVWLALFVLCFDIASGSADLTGTKTSNWCHCSR